MSDTTILNEITAIVETHFNNEDGGDEHEDILSQILDLCKCESRGHDWDAGTCERCGETYSP